MKKIIGFFVMLIVMMLTVSVATIGVFAADGDTQIKLKVSAQKLDGSMVTISSHTDMEKGWDEAMDLASDSDAMDDNGYIFVVVDILADWTATDGKFNKNGHDSGYYKGALCIPSKAIVMVNLNGHTIDRDLDDYKYNGEVICVDESAYLVINGGKDSTDATVGKITGGFSCNGAGGIHIHDEAKVTLNNVSVSGNCTEDDDGAGIALYNSASLVVNGGEISNNTVYFSKGAAFASFLGLTRYSCYGAGVYVKDASAEFNNVTFAKNKGYYGDTQESVDGDVIGALDSKVKMTGCKVFENSMLEDEFSRNSRMIYIVDSTMEIENCDFYSNGSKDSDLFHCAKSTLSVNLSNIYENGVGYIIFASETKIKMDLNTIRDNAGGVMRIQGNDCTAEIKNTTFNNNTAKHTDKFDFYIFNKLDEFYFSNCDFGDSTFNNKEHLQFKSSYTASIVSGESFTVLISLVSLAVSIAALFVVVYGNKKKTGISNKDE